MGKPGIMLYFEICPCLKLMTQNEKGELLDAMMAYGQSGEEPELTEKLQIIWPLIRDKLDRDTDRYNRIVIRNEYASYAKSAAKNQEEKLSYSQWLESNYPNENQWED